MGIDYPRFHRKDRRGLRRIAIIYLILLGLTAAPQRVPAAEDKPKAALGARLHLVDFAGVESTSGGFAVETWELMTTYRRFTLNYQYSDYVWNNVHALPLANDGRTPWDHLQTLKLSFRCLEGQLGSWGYRVDPLVQSSFEKELSGSVGLGAEGYLFWPFAKGWTLDFPYNLNVLTTHDRLKFFVNLSIGLGFPEQSIQEVLLGWGVPPWLARAVDLHLEFSQIQQYYRLADDNPMDPAGTLWINESLVALILDIKPREDLAISLGPEYRFSRHAAMDDPLGMEGGSWDIDGAWGFSIEVIWKF